MNANIKRIYRNIYYTANMRDFDYFKVFVDMSIRYINNKLPNNADRIIRIVDNG